MLNLSLGVDARRSYVREPLAYAAEQLWKRGIAVVAAAGNQADGTGRLDLPAADPFLIAVGATDTQHTADPADDTVADFSSRDALRPPDVVAPGHRRRLAARAGLDARRGVPGRPRRRRASSAAAARRRRRGRLRARRAAARGAPRADARPGQGAAARRARSTLPADVSADGAGRVDLARSLALATPSAAEAGAALRSRPCSTCARCGPTCATESRGDGAARVGTGENGWTGPPLVGPQLVRAPLVGSQLVGQRLERRAMAAERDRPPARGGHLAARRR